MHSFHEITAALDFTWTPIREPFELENILAVIPPPVADYKMMKMSTEWLRRELAEY